MTLMRNDRLHVLEKIAKGAALYLLYRTGYMTTPTHDEELYMVPSSG